MGQKDRLRCREREVMGEGGRERERGYGRRGKGQPGGDLLWLSSSRGSNTA